MPYIGFCREDPIGQVLDREWTRGLVGDEAAATQLIAGALPTAIVERATGARCTAATQPAGSSAASGYRRLRGLSFSALIPSSGRKRLCWRRHYLEKNIATRK